MDIESIRIIRKTPKMSTPTLGVRLRWRKSATRKIQSCSFIVTISDGGRRQENLEDDLSIMFVHRADIGKHFYRFHVLNSIRCITMRADKVADDCKWRTLAEFINAQNEDSIWMLLPQTKNVCQIVNKKRSIHHRCTEKITTSRSIRFDKASSGRDTVPRLDHNNWKLAHLE